MQIRMHKVPSDLCLYDYLLTSDHGPQGNDSDRYYMQHSVPSLCMEMTELI
jgi:hypothetical protein